MVVQSICFVLPEDTIGHQLLSGILQVLLAAVQVQQLHGDDGSQKTRSENRTGTCTFQISGTNKEKSISVVARLTVTSVTANRQHRRRQN